MLRTLYAVYNHLRLGRPYYVLPVVAAAIAGYWSGSDVPTLCANGGIVCLVFLMLGMACWTANEITDRHSDSRGRTKMKWGIYVSGGTSILSSGRLSIKSAVTYVVMIAMAGLAIAVLLGFAFLGLSTLFLLIGLAYSLKPVRLKERGILGLAAVALAYGVVAFTAGWVAGGHRPTAESFFFASILSIAFFGFEGLAHLLDYDQDRLNEETTLAVSLSRETARKVLAVCQCLPALVLFLLSLFAHASVPDLNLVLLVPLLFICALMAALTTKCHEESLLGSLRVLSVPLMSVFAFLIV